VALHDPDLSHIGPTCRFVSAAAQKRSPLEPFVNVPVVNYPDIARRINGSVLTFCKLSLLKVWITSAVFLPAANLVVSALHRTH
jgi:hypothetical protein